MIFEIELNFVKQSSIKWVLTWLRGVVPRPQLALHVGVIEIAVLSSCFSELVRKV
jgi:hypothetical protein